MDSDLKIVIQRWIELANQDLRTARSILNDDPPITNNACFHSQQCAEKSLKAFLVSCHQHTEKTHDLITILKRCISQDSQFEPLKDTAIILNVYAVTVRYPDDWREIPVTEAEEAVTNAEKVLGFVRSKLVQFL